MNPLSTLLVPTSIAVIGASADTVRIRGLLFQQIAWAGFAGPIFPITASATEIAGHRCYPTLPAVGAPVDLAVVATPPGFESTYWSQEYLFCADEIALPVNNPFVRTLAFRSNFVSGKLTG